MNIFLFELKAYRKSSIIWALSMASLSAMYILLFSAIGDDIDAFINAISNMPEVVQKMLNIYLDLLSTLEGFYSFVFLYIILCGAIQAMNFGVSVISKEISDKTADFLLTKPVSRVKILAAKILATFVSLIFTNAIYLFVTLLMTTTVKSEFNMKIFLMITATLFFVQLMFMSLGIIVSVVIGKIRSVIAISLSTVFGFFIVGMLGSVIGDEAVRYITPFKYFDLAYVMENAAYETSFVIVAIVFIIVTIATSFWVYGNKDIHAV